MLNITRQLLLLRKKEAALGIGAYVPLEAAGDIFAFGRQHGNEWCVIVLNLTDQAQRWPLAEMATHSKVGFSSQGRDGLKTAVLHLHPNEGVILLPAHS